MIRFSLPLVCGCLHGCFAVVLIYCIWLELSCSFIGYFCLWVVFCGFRFESLDGFWLKFGFAFLSVFLFVV